MPWKNYDSTGAEKVTEADSMSLVTALPSSPVDGQEIILTDSLSAGTYHWHLRYVAARSSNKWVFIGGSPFSALIATSESMTATSYQAMTTPGPSVAVPVAGDYIVEHGALFTVSNTIFMSYDIGATGAVDVDSVRSNSNGYHFRRKSKLALTAVTLTSKYRVDAGTHSAAERFLGITPIAIGG